MDHKREYRNPATSKGHGSGWTTTTSPRVYVDLQYNEISLTFTAGSVSFCCVSSLEGCGGVMSVLVVSLDTLCRWQVQVSIYCAWRVPTHPRCTQCSILLHLMDICFLTCIYLWPILKIQRQPSSGSAWPACPKKTVNRASIAGGGRFRHNLHSSLYPL